MATVLLPCARCGRHVRWTEHACPFCSTRFAPWPVVVAVAVGVAGANVACSKDNASPPMPPAAVSSAGSPAGASSSGAPRAMTSAERELLAQELDQLEIATLVYGPGAVGSVGSPVDGVPVMPPASAGADGATDARAGRVTARAAVVEPAAGVELPGLERSVGIMSNGFLRCYQAPSNPRPRAAARVSVDTVVDNEGAVRSARASSPDGVDPAVLECIGRRVGSARFKPPTPAGDVRIRIDVSFAKQDR